MADAAEADKGPLRIVLLGESSTLLPSPLYHNHVLQDDLASQNLNVDIVKEYFNVFCLSRAIALDPAQIQGLADEAIVRAEQIMEASQKTPVPWARALAQAVLEKTQPLDALAQQKRSEP